MIADPIVGLDLSLSKTGVAGPDGVTVIQSKLRGPARMIDIRDRVLRLIPPGGLVALEGFAFSRANAAHDIGGLGWVIRVALFEAGVPYLLVSTNQLKKFATGKGNAKKPHVVSAVTLRTGLEWSSDDAVDSFVARCMGMEVAGQAHPLGLLPQGHLSAISDLSWGDAVGWRTRAVAAP